MPATARSIAARDLAPKPLIDDVAVAVPKPAPEPVREGNTVSLHGIPFERSHDPDAQLVERCQKGDMRAFEMLVRKHQSRIIHLVQRFVGESDAEDVAQESFIRAHRAMHKFKGEAMFSTWLHRIAVNTSKNYLVARRRRPIAQSVGIDETETMGPIEALSDTATPEAEVLTEEIRDSLDRAVSKLPRELRQAFVLCELKGLSYDEIATIMQCPIGTVRSRIFRARETLDKALARLGY